MEKRAVTTPDVQDAASRTDHSGNEGEIFSHSPYGSIPSTALAGSRSRETAMPANPVQEPGNGIVKLGLVQQKRVMALVGFNLNETDIGGDSIQRTDNLSAFGCKN